MYCHCDEVDELSGDVARNYAHDHLVEVEVRAYGWEWVFRCPDTQWVWLLDYARGAEPGNGPARLRRFDTAPAARSDRP